MTEPTPADPRARAAATGVDLLAVLLLATTAGALTAGSVPVVRLAAVLVAVGVPTYAAEGVLGRTLGDLALGLRTVTADGRPAGLPTLAGRFLLQWLVPAMLWNGGLWLPALTWWLCDVLPALGPRRRAVHDRLTRSVVVGGRTGGRADL